MKAKLIVEGKEFPIEIQDPELQKLLTPQKKTGYERIDKPNTYYYYYPMKYRMVNYQNLH